MLVIPEGSVWKDTVSDTVYVVKHVQDAWDVTDAGNTQVEVETVPGGEWYGKYRDNFEKNCTKVADSLEEYEGGA